ncbi:alpha/beta fold hydrolase [Rhodobacteraceae bacterium CCMM004]|nr:alpha/beta fold hydrolase [Rhodobacteraceae bacterium CCMM004]
MPFADRHVTVDGRQVAYVDVGPRGGMPTVLLHGGGFDHAELSWRLTVAALKPRLRMIAPDLPGYGDSAPLPGPNGIPQLGAWLVAFLDAVGVAQANVCGLSMGGGMALWLALENPGRVARLVPVGAYGIMERAPLHPLAWAVSRMPLRRLGYLAVGHSRLVARLGLGATYARGRRVTDETVDELMAVARDQAERQSFARFLGAELSSAALATSLLPRLGEIAAPTLFIHGSGDRLVPLRHARRAAALVPGAVLEVMDTGHWPMRELPETFNPILGRFLEGG